MSLMTAVSGAASLLLLLIPTKFQPEQDFVVSCCSNEFCVDDNGTLFAVTSFNSSIASCGNQEDISFDLMGKFTIVDSEEGIF